MVKPTPLQELILPINRFSDGDPEHLPTQAGATQDVGADLHREKLGRLWAERRGELRAGFKYTIDRLPQGYTVWGRPRPNDPKHIDKWLFGHPSHKVFDSPNRFAEHFLHLMESGNADKCQCVCCNKGKEPKAAPRAGAAGAPRPRGRPSKKLGTGIPDAAVKSVYTDEEGNVDVFKVLIEKLKRYGKLEEEIRETKSIDWRSERKILDREIQKMTEQPSWLPRIGELVLFVRDLADDEEIVLNDNTGGSRIQSHKTHTWRPPIWEAGIISQTPEERSTIDDLLRMQPKQNELNYSGFRVEPMADPNSNDKSLTRHYKYVAMSQIRPFAFFEVLLKGVEVSEWDMTVDNGLNIASTISIRAKHKFSGTWPRASVHCKGLFIGAESILVGDCVRVFASRAENPNQIDIVHITAIKVSLWDLDKASSNDNDEGHPYNSAIRLEGIMYTKATSRARGNPACRQDDLPPVLRGYSPLYLTRRPGDRVDIPFWRVAGRMFEASAMRRWFPPSSDGEQDNDSYLESLLTKGVHGINESRLYSTKSLRRITEHAQEGRKWFWADSRSEALDLQTLNGQEVALFDGERDSRAERGVIRVLDGEAPRAGPGRPPKTSIAVPASSVEMEGSSDDGQRRGSVPERKGMVEAALEDYDEEFFREGNGDEDDDDEDDESESGDGSDNLDALLSSFTAKPDNPTARTVSIKPMVVGGSGNARKRGTSEIDEWEASATPRKVRRETTFSD